MLHWIAFPTDRTDVLEATFAMKCSIEKRVLTEQEIREMAVSVRDATQQEIETYRQSVDYWVGRDLATDTIKRTLGR
jgi:hypothetical protein